MFWDKKEEHINLTVHFIAFFLSLVFSIVFFFKLFKLDLSLTQLIFAALYAVTASMLFMSSCLYHGVNDTLLKTVCRKIDITFSLLFIPICQSLIITLFLPDAEKHWLLRYLMEFNWCVSLLVAGLSALHHHSKTFYHTLNSVSALICGWSTVFICYELYLEQKVFLAAMLIVGGVFYSLGCYFFIYDTKKRYYHAYWHIASMTGAFIHYFAIIYSLHS